MILTRIFCRSSSCELEECVDMMSHVSDIQLSRHPNHCVHLAVFASD